MFMKKYQLLNTFQWLLMTLFFLFFIMGCDDDEKVREEEEKITIGEDQLAIELDAEDTSASIKFTALASRGQQQSRKRKFVIGWHFHPNKELADLLL